MGESMNAYPSVKQEPQRESRKFWVVDDGTVRYVTGYSYKPNNPTYWWFPEVGWSCSIGHSVFETKATAIASAIRDMENDIAVSQRKLKDLIKMQAV